MLSLSTLIVAHRMGYNHSGGRIRIHITIVTNRKRPFPRTVRTGHGRKNTLINHNFSQINHSSQTVKEGRREGERGGCVNKRNMCPKVTVVSISKRLRESEREGTMQPRGNYLISPLLSLSPSRPTAAAFGTLLSFLSPCMAMARSWQPSTGLLQLGRL